MGMQRLRQTLTVDGSVATGDEIQGSPSACHRVDDGDSKDGETSTNSVPYLPEEIWRHIHSLMPMDAAARAACLSHAFLSSWRCYPKLNLNRHTLCSYDGNLISRIDRILRNHSGSGLKMLRLYLCCEYGFLPYVDNWLQLAVAPGIEELTLSLHENYKFPCSLLSDRVRSSIRSLQLDSCGFHPTLELGPLRSLTKLTLSNVRIKGEELECLLSNSLALEHLDLTNCKEIIFLKIPSMLLQLSYVMVCGCEDLRVIENEAPYLSSFNLFGGFSKLSLGEASQMLKLLNLYCDYVVYYARAMFPSIMPNLETLILGSRAEVNTPMLPTKFLNLKHLTIQIGVNLSPSYDYVSLISFLDASPLLETWYLDVSHKEMEHESVFGGSPRLRQLPVRHHDRLKSVEIIGFSSAKSLVELTSCIVKSAASLERLKLDTLNDAVRCSEGNDDDFRDHLCSPISKAALEEAFRGVLAIRMYIEDKVPPTAKSPITKFVS